MNTFIGINNVERFGDQLCSAADRARHATLMRLRVEEEDNLWAGLEQLDAAEIRIAKCHQLIASQRVIVARIESDGWDAEQANILLSALLEVQELFEGYRRRIQNALDQRSLWSRPRAWARRHYDAGGLGRRSYERVQHADPALILLKDATSTRVVRSR